MCTDDVTNFIVRLSIDWNSSTFGSFTTSLTVKNFLLKFRWFILVEVTVLLSCYVAPAIRLDFDYSGYVLFSNLIAG